jgi:uncharacterized membrane protein YdbT with pleckstrin-like domain
MSNFEKQLGGRQAVASDPGEDLLTEERPIKELLDPAARKRADKGLPPNATISEELRYYFYPTWRSQLFPLIGYVILCALAVWGSNVLPYSVISGKLFAIGDIVFFLDLPLFIFLPGFLLARILLYIYDSKYIIDERGVEAQIGLVSLHLRQPRLRWEDIRGVEPNQTLWERILGIGSVLVGSAMTNDVEIVMEGVDNPRAIQLLIGSERDKRLRELQEALGSKD